MTIELKHQKVSSVSDSGNTDLVQPSDWNDDHDLTQATDRILGRVTAGVGATEELTAAQVKTFLAVDDADVAAVASATNYTPGGSTVDGHLSGIDTALGNAVDGPASATDSAVAQFDGTTGKLLKNGVSIGTSANNLVQLDGSAKLPAVDGSALTNLRTLSTQIDVYTSSGTWTKPANLVSVEVEVNAGGGGSRGSTGDGGAGGTSSFGAHCSATGGGGGTASLFGTAGAGASGDVNNSGGIGGVHATVTGLNTGGSSPGPHGGGVALSSAVNYGGGAGTNVAGQGGGGGGGRSYKVIAAASLSSSETVTVGAGGTAGTGTNSNAGAGGIVVVVSTIFG